MVHITLGEHGNIPGSPARVQVLDKRMVEAVQSRRALPAELLASLGGDGEAEGGAGAGARAPSTRELQRMVAQAVGDGSSAAKVSALPQAAIQLLGAAYPSAARRDALVERFRSAVSQQAAQVGNHCCPGCAPLACVGVDRSCSTRSVSQSWQPRSLWPSRTCPNRATPLRSSRAC